MNSKFFTLEEFNNYFSTLIEIVDLYDYCNMLGVNFIFGEMQSIDNEFSLTQIIDNWVKNYKIDNYIVITDYVNNIVPVFLLIKTDNGFKTVKNLLKMKNLKGFI